MHALKAIAKPAGIILVIVFAVIMFMGAAITYGTQHGDLQAQFLKGTVPAQLPDGAYRGTVPGYGGTWYGKEFSARTATGINLFSNGQSLTKNYRFKIYRAKGIRDSQLDVLRIDYDVDGNPAWLRMVTDEIVQTEPGHFLGKLHLRAVPGYPFALGFFELRKS